MQNTIIIRITIYLEFNVASIAEINRLQSSVTIGSDESVASTSYLMPFVVTLVAVAAGEARIHFTTSAARVSIHPRAGGFDTARRKRIRQIQSPTIDRHGMHAADEVVGVNLPRPF